jgi:hypothetical protein
MNLTHIFDRLKLIFYNYSFIQYYLLPYISEAIEKQRERGKLNIERDEINDKLINDT